MARGLMSRTLLCVSSGVLTVTACGGDSDVPESFGRSEADALVEATLVDFAFQGLPASIRSGKVFFATTNVGPADHELEILSPDGTPVDEIEAHPAGESRTLAVRLTPGSYTVQCILKTADGKSHSELGMTAQLQVQ